MPMTGGKLRYLQKDFSKEEWRGIISSFCDVSLLQTWEYGEAKAQSGSWKVERSVFLDGNDRVIGAAQCMVRPVPVLGGGGVWLNRGPLWRTHENESLSTLFNIMDELRQYWVNERRMYLLVAPPVRQEQVNNREFEQHGYSSLVNGDGWASAMVDLSVPEEQLRKNLNQKWRNCLNKAERSGLQCEWGTDLKVFQEVMNEYSRMLAEKKLSGSISPAMLSVMQEYFEEKGKLWSLVARNGEQTIGVVLIARYGNVAEYLAGAFNDEGRKLNAGNLLLWQAIRQMKEQGYRWFDLGGMHPEKTPKGIFHFKSGVGGEPYKLYGPLESFKNGVLNNLIRWRVGKLG